jgi:quercetin dioxygenase-like cupin family protein
MSKSSDQESSGITVDDAVFSELAKALLPISPPPVRAAHLRSQIMERVAQEKRTVSGQFVTMRADEGWFELAPKIEKKVLYVDREAGTESYLLRVQPGAVGPAHKHARDELCVVLEGDFYLGDIHLKAGDFHMASAGSTHGQAHSKNGALVFQQGAIEDQNV